MKTTLEGLRLDCDAAVFDLQGAAYRLADYHDNGVELRDAQNQLQHAALDYAEARLRVVVEERAWTFENFNSWYRGLPWWRRAALKLGLRRAKIRDILPELRAHAAATARY